MSEYFANSTTTVPHVLTPIEACLYLRLDVDRVSESAMLKSLDRLVEKKLVRPAKIGRYRRYSKVELDRYVDARTEEYGECA